MIRVLLVVIAIVVAVLALIFDRPWLYAAAAVPLVGALGLLGRQFWTAYQHERDRSSRPGGAPDDSLQDLGIMDVRPQEENGSDSTSAGAPTPSSVAETENVVSEEHSSETESTDGSSSEDWPESVLSEEEMDAMASATYGTPVYSDEQPVLSPFLESVRAALGAQTACLLVQEDVALEYKVKALASVQPDAQQGDVFETECPLLTATMSHQAVSVRSLEVNERKDLGYYTNVPAITQVAVAPVGRSDAPATVFLLADATTEVDLGTSQARSLLEHFSETVGLLLDVVDSGGIQAGRSAPESPPVDADEATESTDEPRPRREIIAEEMESADMASEELSLVLVHLNRAESIARRGEEAVALAERNLHSRLEDLAPGARVERFGELTYGIFTRRGGDAVEGWAADLQDALANETGELEGGVSVGVAVRDAHHEPEQLRADATEALLEAYETGTCTIIG